MRRVCARLRRRNRGSSWPSESFGMASSGMGLECFVVMAFSLFVFTCIVGGYKSGGKSRAVEKSKARTFPRHLKILVQHQDFHFSHRPYYGDLFQPTPQKTLHQERLGTT